MIYDRLLQPLHRSPFRSTLLQTCYKEFNKTTLNQLGNSRTTLAYNITLHYTFTLTIHRLLVLAYTFVYANHIYSQWNSFFKTQRTVSIRLRYMIIISSDNMLQDKRSHRYISTSSSFKHNKNHCKTMQARPLNSRPISVLNYVEVQC